MKYSVFIESVTIVLNIRVNLARFYLFVKKMFTSPEFNEHLKDFDVHTVRD